MTITLIKTSYKNQAVRDLRDGIMPNLSLEGHVRRVMREAKYISVSVEVAMKYMDSCMFKKIYQTYARVLT